jgi:hypothetical protein
MLWERSRVRVAPRVELQGQSECGPDVPVSAVPCVIASNLSASVFVQRVAAPECRPFPSDSAADGTREGGGGWGPFIGNVRTTWSCHAMPKGWTSGSSADLLAGRVTRIGVRHDERWSPC